MPNYTLTSSTETGAETLTVIYDNGDCVPVKDTHPNFSKIEALLRSRESTDQEIKMLVNAIYSVGERLSKITDRVSYTDNNVFFDNDPLREELKDVLLEAIKADDNKKFTSLARFLEKTKENPSQQSVDDLYRWIIAGSLIIYPDGDFGAYKGVKLTSAGEPVSINAGPAIVDGIAFNGYVPNNVGSTIEMPRSQVNADSNVACSTGLHAGTHEYAAEFARGMLLLVKINPRDVVSVPSDSNGSKLRVSRYVVLETIEHKLKSSYYGSYDEDEEDYPDEYYDSEEDEDYEYDDDDDDCDCDCAFCLDEED